MPRGVYERKDTPQVTQQRAAESKVDDDTNHRTTPVRQDERLNTGLTYIALKPLKVNGERRMPGEFVPEAKLWRNVHNYISSGHLAPVKESEHGNGADSRGAGAEGV